MSAFRSGHELDLLISGDIRDHKWSGLKGFLDSEIYLNPDLANDFRSVLRDYFNHNAIRPFNSDLNTSN